ncbi:inositol monophosphatase [Phycicoccus sp. CSK15P-2]|uniref:inositol monophosphatase family protein n=1 Tax=Phycicoccus sp. CSK15P-2 TaxID=2807627 RepID=UPI0019518522|nr:inositol monophosphatase family protein [Phycicoccus sp. CSK15P-2]MBM6403994.1 inositol monophosphatase [Phycicoccus sp. CSK15P-2]
MGGPTLPAGVAAEELEAVARAVAEEAGRLVVEERPDALGTSVKSTRTDVVTEMDQRSQELLVARLATLRPDDAVLGEEEGGASGTSGITWVVDPIDGTVNYLYGIPEFSVSVAAVVGDPTTEDGWEPVAGAVLNPVRGELFHAHAGGGAWCTTATGTRPVRTSDATDLGLSLVGTGFGYDAGLRERQARLLVDLLPQVRDIRRQGSAALDLCAVACGRLDAYYETGLNAWDRAAGQLVAREAGAVLGGPVDASLARQLSWAAAPGLAEPFGAVVRDLTDRHVGASDSRR